MYSGRIFQVVTLVLLVLLAAVPSTAAKVRLGESLTARVVAVLDGDSGFIERAGRRQEFRLWGIDSPEHDQPFARYAHKLSRELLLWREVSVTIKDVDRYGRWVVLMHCGDLTVNRELVRLGGAWVYRRYCHERYCDEWEQLAKQAKMSKVGLWQQSDAVPPWQWRRRQ